MRDFGLVDLPYPLRRLSLNPLGVLYKKRIDDEDKYIFRRGTEAFPTIGDGVFLPTDNQLRSIVESCEKPRIKIGTSPLAGNADVYVDPDRLFGRHLAVLGNTGSGKSCTVAGLIRWSLEAAQKKQMVLPMPGSLSWIQMANMPAPFLMRMRQSKQEYLELTRKKLQWMIMRTNYKYRSGFGIAPNGVRLVKQGKGHSGLSLGVLCGK